jgi:signal transduction histidine kinase
MNALEEIDADAVALLVHELNTPLSSLRLLLGTLVDRVTARRFERQLSRIDAALLNAVGDARLGGSLLLRVSEVDLVALAARVVEDAGLLEPPREVTLEVRGAPPTARADRTRLEQALANLVHNAFKYSVAGAPVHVRVVSLIGRVRLEVEDAGPTTEAMPDRGSLRPGGGAGLGLGFVRAVVEAHGGKLTAWRAEAGGSVVGFEIPQIG